MTVEQQALQLPRTEKLRLMEALWTDLTPNEDGFESPSWHEAALRETEKRLSNGQEQTLDWEEAKRRLRGELGHFRKRSVQTRCLRE